MRTQLADFWTERFLPDPPREKDHRPPFRRDRDGFYILPLSVVYKPKHRFMLWEKMIFIALV